MENATNNSFEEQWQRAFDDASSPPSEAVWERIELGLESNIPPKSGNGLYYIGAISAVILCVGLLFFMSKKEEKKSVQVIEKKVFIPKKNVENIATKIEEKLIIKSKEKTQITKILIPEKQEIIQSDVIVKESENQERIITDSIDFISPIIGTPKINSELANPSVNMPFENTLYYEIPKPKSKKKSIFDKVRISGGVGIYQ